MGAEIGVFRGHFTRDILRKAKPRQLHLIDGWWELYGERYPDWGEYTDFGRLPTRSAYEEAVAIVDSHARGAKCDFHVGDDRQILATFPDSYFDWVYLDSSHDFDHTLEELGLLERKVAPHGLITGDDYWVQPDHVHHGVYRAVHRFLETHPWELKALDGFQQWCIARKPSN